MPNITVAQSIAALQSALGYWVPTVGTSSEPAITAANMTQQVMLSPPFKWAWNRNSATFQTTQYTQDYTVSVSDFGYLEKATFQPSGTITQVQGDGTTATLTGSFNVNNTYGFKQGQLANITITTHTGFSATNAILLTASATQITYANATVLSATADTGTAVSGRIMPLTTLNSTPLGDSSDPQQPTTLAVQQNTVGTSIKVRFLGIPNGLYNVVLWYQKFVPLFTVTSGNWTPPDYLSYVYNKGFLAELFEALGMPGEAQAKKVQFAAALLANAEGLTDTEINIFLAQYLGNPRALESVQLKTQQGIQARGSQ